MKFYRNLAIGGISWISFLIQCFCTQNKINYFTTCLIVRYFGTKILDYSTNAGSREFGWMATCTQLQLPVYYNERSIANIWALKDIADLFRVTMDSAVERAMIVHTGDGSFMKFRECGDGLYYFDTQNDQIESFDTTDSCSATDDYTHIVSDAENSDSHEEEMDTTVGHNEIKQTVQGYSFLSTVEANKEHFHRDEIEGVDRARTLQHSLDWKLELSAC